MDVARATLWIRSAGIAVRKLGLPTTIALLAVIWMFATGHYTATVDSDTASYLYAAGSGHFLNSTRAPVYGWLLNFLPWNHWVSIPAVQALVFGASTGFLMDQMNRYGASWFASGATGFSALLSNTFFLDAHQLIPETLAISAAMIAFSAALMQNDRHVWRYVVVSAAAGAAYILRPIFLPLMFVLPSFVFVTVDSNRRLKSAIMTLVASSIPFLGFSAVRWVSVGDFNVVSYGGYQASALATLMLDPEVLGKLHGADFSFASRALATMHQQESAGTIIGVPLNSSGARSFPSAALGYPDVLARTYDQVLNGVIVPSRRLGEDWVSFNKRLLEFDVSVFRSKPEYIALWTAGQVARLLGHGAVLNGAMLLASLAAMFGIGTRVGGNDTDYKLISALTVGWLIASGLLAVTASFSAERYIDSAALFFPVLPAYWALRGISAKLARIISRNGVGG